MAKCQSQWIAAVVLWAAAVAVTGPATLSARAEAPQAPAVAAAPGAPAEAAHPPLAASAPAATDLAHQLLRPASPSPLEGKTLRPGAPGGGAGDWWRMLAALAAVLALVFVLRMLLRRYAGARPSAGGSRVVEVLSRTSVSPRHQVLLVRVGGRLLVVGAAAESLNVLAEISDPVEMGELLGAVERGKAGSLSNSFSHALRGWRGEIDKVEAEPVTADALGEGGAASSPASGGLARPIGEAVERVKSMLDRLRRRGEGPGGRP